MIENNTPNIRNIIFDLGGVLLNINPLLSLLELGKISETDIETLKTRFTTEGIFEKFDTGSIDAGQFRRMLCQILNRTVSDTEIDRIWNMLLLDFPVHRLEMLQQIRGNYQVILLSNTNIIHFEKYTADFFENYRIPFTSLFDKLFLSYEIGIHKPDVGIYTYVLENAGINAEQTAFFDDSLANIRAAEQSGIKTFHIHNGIDVTDFFENGLLKPAYVI
ncbi:MAG: HAD family phosphatase [Bacteroidales bacterium]